MPRRHRTSAERRSPRRIPGDRRRRLAAHVRRRLAPSPAGRRARAVRHLRRLAPDGPQVLQLVVVSSALAPIVARAECYEAAVVLDAQRRARQTLMTMNRHADQMRGLTADARATPDPSGLGGGYVMEGSIWDDLPICGREGASTTLVPADLSLHLHHRPSAGPWAFGANLLMLATTLGHAGGDEVTDGLRWYVGGRAAYGAWVEGAIGAIIEDEVGDGPSVRPHLGLAVPSLHLSLSAILGEAALEPPETVLLDVDIPWAAPISTPIRLTWREDEQRLALGGGVDVGRWLQTRVVFEDSARVLRSARVRLMLDILGPDSIFDARPAPDAPPAPREGNSLAFAFAVDHSNGQALHDAIGQSAWGVAIESTMRFTKGRSAGEIRLGQSINEASVLDDMPHLVNVSGYYVHVSLSRVWE